MANYSKNIFVGCAGSTLINKSHYLGALCGLENLMGKDHSAVREVFDYAEEHFLSALPLAYVLTVCTSTAGSTDLHGLYIGRSRALFERAVALSQKLNISFIDHAPKKIIVKLDEHEFHSTWVGNKAVYRTRLAIADGGELIVIAKGVRAFGEDDENDRLIRKYGFVGTRRILELTAANEELQNNRSVAAHIMHASSEGRFNITYATVHLSREEIESVGFNYMAPAEVEARYGLQSLKPGFNTVNGEEIYYIENPAVGLWASREIFERRAK